MAWCARSAIRIGHDGAPAWLALVALLLAAPAAACPGDCDGDGEVGVAELIVAVRIGSG